MLSKNTFAVVLVAVFQDYKNAMAKQYSAEDLDKHLNLAEFVKWLEDYDQANVAIE